MCLLFDFSFEPKTAYDLLDDAEEAIMSLAEYHGRHRLAEDPVLRSWGIRFFL